MINESPKLMSTKEAIKKFVHDGDTLSITSCGTAGPYALIHEIIRQKKKNLTAVQATCMHELDLLAGCGCLKKVISSWSYRIVKGQRAFDRGVVEYNIEVQDYTNYTVAAMLMAGALNLPFFPAKPSILYTDIWNRHKEGMFKLIDNPFNPKEKVLLVPAIKPDVAIVHCQRVDQDGNAQLWGALGTVKHGALASKRIIVSAEEMVPREVVRLSPNNTIIPGFRVDAICIEPWGAHPSEVLGYYDMDRMMVGLYSAASVSKSLFSSWVDEWIYNIEDRYHYIEHYTDVYGMQPLHKLRARVYPSASVNLGSSFLKDMELLELKMDDILDAPEMFEVEVDEN
ncbi:MAG: CoA transferase subunit A [Candidatus Helarchaeota archaeon]